MGKQNFLVITAAVAILALALGFATGSLVRASLSEESQSEEMEREEEGKMAGHEHHHKHDHEMLEVNQDAPIPDITIEVEEDEKSGYNLFLQLENFIFTPDNVNADPVDNEGHAHLFINGEKEMRVYSQWLHIGNDMLLPGENEIVVTLNANDHSEYVRDGEHIEARVSLER